jgi:sec-independent protein translocase protein TatA
VGGLLEGWHPIVLLVIALIVFGPGKLPEVFGQAGRGIREFRQQMDGTATSSDKPKEIQP